MKNKFKHKALSSRHVFSENGFVFARSTRKLGKEEWSPINFHWMPFVLGQEDRQ